jgi:hypothetical protein
MEMARIYHDQTELNAPKKADASAPHGLISHQVFYNIRNNRDRQTALALDLMRAVEIPRHLQQYGIELLPTVQEYYDQVNILLSNKFIQVFQKYPLMYRIVCISDLEIPTVIWKGPLGRKYEVTILHAQGENHFDALKSISRFYKLKNFCVDCEEPYHDARDHSKCKV